MISKTDKANSMIVLYLEEHKDKISKFITSNNLTVANSDVTKKTATGRKEYSERIPINHTQK
jgi:hypothetical protein